MQKLSRRLLVVAVAASAALGLSACAPQEDNLAKQANGSCTVRYGDTVVIATACMEHKAGVERDFLPLTVDYREYTSAAGKIPGGFFKREGRPTEKEIITSRQIDRQIATYLASRKGGQHKENGS